MNEIIDENPKQEEPVEKIAKELSINLPKKAMGTALKLIALFTLVGGLGIIGSIFADIVNPLPLSFGFYLLRFIIGLTFLGIAYGIVETQRWAIWLYGFVIIIGLLINPALTIIPAVIVIYLWYRRKEFQLSIFDRLLETAINYFRKKL